MAYRYTNTDKWNDAWFVSLKPEEKLLFNYLCDNCDIAGFIEIIPHRWAADLGYNQNIIQGALKGLGRGLRISESGDCIFINNFLKHQKNLPLNENNKAHLGIIRRFELYSNKFQINNTQEFIEGGSKGLSSPTGIGNGKGSGIGNGKMPEPKFSFKKELINLGVEEQVVSDWLKVRAKKKAANTETAFNRIKIEIEKCFLNPNECITMAVEKSWQGFNSEWVDNAKTQKTNNNPNSINDIWQK